VYGKGGTSDVRERADIVVLGTAAAGQSDNAMKRLTNPDFDRSGVVSLLAENIP